jgi:hypothetical protein
MKEYYKKEQFHAQIRENNIEPKGGQIEKNEAKNRMNVSNISLFLLTLIIVSFYTTYIIITPADTNIFFLLIPPPGLISLLEFLLLLGPRLSPCLLTVDLKPNS